MSVFLTGKVWLGVLSGKTQPPVFVSGEQVFAGTPIKSRILAFWEDVKDKFAEVKENVKEAMKQPDKRRHFIIGFLISLLIGIATTPFVGLAVGCVAGGIKEWWDSRGHGTVELMDFVFTACGALCAIPFAYLINFIIW